VKGLSLVIFFILLHIVNSYIYGNRIRGQEMTAVKHILLVDDDADLREALAEQLGLYDEFTTRQCGSGAEALEAARQETFDLIILDVGLPDIDGKNTDYHADGRHHRRRHHSGP
jgi:response regulator RpfG family c-di-GMP phosphodiesterase